MFSERCGERRAPYQPLREAMLRPMISYVEWSRNRVLPYVLLDFAQNNSLVKYGWISESDEVLVYLCRDEVLSR
jgi:hypothetical protein